MLKNKTLNNFRPYSAPASELLESLPEALLCVSGDGTIDPATEENWGSF